MYFQGGRGSTNSLLGVTRLTALKRWRGGVCVRGGRRKRGVLRGRGEERGVERRGRERRGLRGRGGDLYYVFISVNTEAFRELTSG